MDILFTFSMTKLILSLTRSFKLENRISENIGYTIIPRLKIVNLYSLLISHHREHLTCKGPTWGPSSRAKYLCLVLLNLFWYPSKIFLFLLQYISQGRTPSVYQKLSGKKLVFIIFNLSQTSTFVKYSKDELPEE